VKRDAQRLLKALRETGLLMMADQVLPSAVTILAGEPVKGSWWGHPDGNRIYNTLNELFDHPDVAAVPLVNGKVTFVHRDLWRALVGVGLAGEAWQTAKLPAPAKALLARVRKEGETRASGPAAKQLEARLLVVGEQEHIESGKHVKVLRTWELWAKARALKGPWAGRAALEDAARAWGPVKLPWGRLKFGQAAD
jgi:hypothetical protein